VIQQLRSRFRQFVRDERGNVFIIMGLGILPVLGIVALGVDYSVTLTTKAKLDTAADAAAVAGVVAAKNYIANYTGSGSPNAGAIAAANVAALSQFNSNTGTTATLGSLSLVTPSFTIVGSTINGAVSYSYTRQTFFGKLLGRDSLTVNNTITATTQGSKTYANIYIMLDNSESMGIAATWTDQCNLYPLTGGHGTCNASTLVGTDHNSDQPCVLACHTASQGNTEQIANCATNPKITLRLDVAKQAIVDAINTLPTDGSVQVAIYRMSNQLTNVVPLTSNFAAAKTAVVGNGVSCAAANTGIQLGSAYGEGGTNITYSLNQLKSQLSPAGSGLTASSPLGFVILVTDAVQDNVQSTVTNFTNFLPWNGTWYNYYNPTQKVSEPTWILEGMDGSQCTGIKNLGYQFYTLYVQYVIPPVTNQASPNAAYQTPLHNNGFPGMFSYVNNTLIPQIPTNMQNCASSPGNYFSANTPTQIETAMQNIFKGITAYARLTQ
jgi:Flp pilus assembly protein TadG